MHLNVITLWTAEHMLYSKENCLLHFDNTVLNNLTITFIPVQLRLQVTYNRTAKTKENIKEIFNNKTGIFLQSLLEPPTLPNPCLPYFSDQQPS